MTIDDLKSRGLILLECISGSKAYGLDTPESDTDIKGVFYLPKERFYGLNYTPQIANEANDVVYYELGRFIDLLVKANPNILELLASPAHCELHRHPIMDAVQPKMFLSKLCKETFAGYAATQIRKARGYKKKIVNPVEQERKSLLDFCFIIDGHSSKPLPAWLSANGIAQERCGLSAVPHAKGMYALYTGEPHYSGIVRSDDANDVATSSIPKGAPQAGYLYFNKEAYSSYCKEYKEYWEWVAKRNETRYQGNMQHGKDYDAKNMMHTVRLLQVAEEIGRTGTLNVVRPNRDELLAIKRGDWRYESLIDLADELMADIEAAYAASALPKLPDRAAAEAVLVAIRRELYVGEAFNAAANKQSR